MTDLRKILVTVDGSETSVKAAAAAVSIAKQHGSKLTFLTVVNVDMYLGEYGVFAVRNMPVERGEIIDAKHKNDQEMLNGIVEKLETKGLEFEKKVISGIPYEVIVNEAKNEDYDLIVMGRRGLTKLERVFLGSVTQKVLAEAPCSVLVIKE